MGAFWGLLRGPPLGSSSGGFSWGCLQFQEKATNNLETIWKKSGKKLEKYGKKEMFDMCFLGVFLGAPGGPPAASLGGPRGHGREEGGENGGSSR